MHFGEGSLYRAPGTIAGETGIHGDGKAIDAPIDPDSALGRTIIADARRNGFYAYTKPHGTGPHIHIETHRNPDGSLK